ncbi:glutamate 5-kinase [Candidatus Nitrospira neomarina]|uniref:Glutamate 5-kinase n=1 Tax=Candidatus Nitrospira neomarina TaxID=3020899 RepID=A0AA96GIX3_9BACT|nr:glutamate 5-kinase [Candidatus Nitrospira neomarina]WNM61787.1 glutamate 5-kinase [Candidatus Nitrospira neomarina]
MREQVLAACKRIVVKVGSSLVASSQGGLRLDRINRLAQELGTLQAQDRQIVVVSSGAIVAGLSHLAIFSYPAELPLQQAAAAVGQSRLMRAYEMAFEETKNKIAQVLLTHQDLSDRRRFLNARHTLNTLIQLRVIPIINENDTVAIEEIRFGDNDTLAGEVAHLVDADLLVILSDVDGLYSQDPHLNPSAELIPLVANVTKDIEDLAGTSRTQASRGGMVTKIRAAKQAGRFGVPTLLLNGETPHALEDVLNGKPGGTFFVSDQSPLTSRKQWIAYTLRPKGEVRLDEGAVAALTLRGKSLLPSGILDITGIFLTGDPITCATREGMPFAQGLTNYSAETLHRIKGKKTSDIRQLLGSLEYEEVIHRDNLVLTKQQVS